MCCPGLLGGVPGMAQLLRVKVPNPPGSGKDTAKVKGVIVRWGLKEDGGKTLACKSCPDRLEGVDEVARQTKVQ